MHIYHARRACQFIRIQFIRGVTLMKDHGVGQLTRSPIHLLHRASQVVENVFASKVEIEDLTPRQLD